VLAPEVHTDILMMAALMADYLTHPLPIMDLDFPAPIYPDVSGHIAGLHPPYLGIFFTASSCQ